MSTAFNYWVDVEYLQHPMLLNIQCENKTDKLQNSYMFWEIIRFWVITIRYIMVDTCDVIYV